MYSFLLKTVALPLMDFATDTHTRKRVNELEKSQWLRRDEVLGLQRKRLKYLVRHAYGTCPYYRRVFREHSLKPGDIKTSEDLLKLPVLSRAELRQGFESLASRRFSRELMILGQSGGSTGEPVRFFTTRENREVSRAARYLGWKWAGFEVGDKFAYIGEPLPNRPFFLSMRERIEGRLMRRICLDVFRMTTESLTLFVNNMKRFKPKVVYGYAKSVAVLAKFIEDKGLGGMHLNAVVVDSEGLLKREVEMIERVFGCRLWWNYHNRENGTFGSECAEHSGYHLFAQNHVFEFVKDGEHCASGEVGSIVVTDLTNFAMPFIRYEIGDLGVPSDEICACGRGLPLMERLIGRTFEVLVSATGEYLIGDLSELYDHFLKVARIKQYQLVQESPDKIVVSVIPEQDYGQRDTDLIMRGVASVLGDMDVEIKLVDEIPKSRSGKVQAVVRKFPIAFA